MEWIPNTAGNQPDQDGRYGIIYRYGPQVRRLVADYSSEEGWLIGMTSFQVIAWCELVEIPDWVINQMQELQC